MKENITVRHIVRNSSARGHRGYLHHSDDNLIAIEKEYHRAGYTHISTDWFFLSD
jgi:hypothetical protein